MKNKFFGIIFAVAALPMFANETMDKAELLSHLKNIKSEVVEFIEEYDRQLEKAGMQDMIMRDHLQDVSREWYNKAEFFQKVFTKETLLPVFDLICKDVGSSFKEIYTKFEHTVGYQSWDSVWMDNQIMKELYELYVPILKKLHEKHPVAQALTDDVIRYCFNDVLYGVCFIRVAGYGDHLLKLIDEKIAELEAQV